MPNPLQKSLHDYLAKITRPPTRNIHLPSRTFSFLSGCRHPRTPSFSVDRHTNGEDAATLADIDRFLFENFRSLYMKDESEESKKTTRCKYDEEKPCECELSLDSPRFTELPVLDLSGSLRFFATPGSSGSLMEEARTSGTTSEEIGSSSSSPTGGESARRESDDEKRSMGPVDFITVLTYSQHPHDDFRRSMMEMVEARLHHGKVDWEFMEELLFCYLNLNDKKSYKYILSAFVDLVLALRENSSKVSTRSRRTRRAGRRRT
ncbi:hypothetical protein NMG60_11004994 [Bertholletia excelsa]